MKSFTFKRSLFSEIWFEDFLLDDETQALIRILQNKLEPTKLEPYQGERIDWEAREKQRKQADYDKWQSYDERDPFHHQIFPTYTQAYALQQAKKAIAEIDSLIEWLCDEKEAKRHVLEWHEIYQRKFELVN
ncbi:hypothetical protein ACFSAV_11520 [Pasteurella oralis]|uniref:Uncharacterized protein n=2 Tax=Pasteurella oralis TaxID=1071947 RepID=A0ABW4NWM4_9PAST